MAEISHLYDKYNGNYLECAFFTVKFRDVFSMQRLYELLHEWLVEEEWAGHVRDDATFPETFYLKREDQVSGIEQWIHWRLKKYAEGSENWRADMLVQFHILNLKDTEVLHQGQKYKANSGEVEIKCWVNLVPEFIKWRENFILKHFIVVFWKRFLWKDRERWKNDFMREGYRFQEAIKGYFKLVTFLPESELQGFYPKKDFTT